MEPIIEQREESGPVSGIMPRDPSAELVMQLRAELAELRHDQERLRRHALRDPISGHYSAAYLEDRVVQEWARMRHDWSRLSALRVRVNGHRRASDISWAGWWVGQVSRPIDVVGRGRGADFVVLMPDTGRGDAERAQRALLARTRRDPNAPAGVELEVTVAVALDDVDTPRALLEAAVDRELDTIPAPPPLAACLVPTASLAPPPLPSDLPM